MEFPDSQGPRNLNTSAQCAGPRNGITWHTVAPLCELGWLVVIKYLLTTNTRSFFPLGFNTLVLSDLSLFCFSYLQTTPLIFYGGGGCKPISHTSTPTTKLGQQHHSLLMSYCYIITRSLYRTLGDVSRVFSFLSSFPPSGS